MLRLKTQDSRLKTQDSRLNTKDSRLKTQDSRLKTRFPLMIMGQVMFLYVEIL